MAADRITYAFNMKINTGDYSSAGFHIGFETDVKADETPSKTLARAQKFVEAHAEKKLKEYQPDKEEEDESGSEKF